MGSEHFLAGGGGGAEVEGGGCGEEGCFGDYECAGWDGREGFEAFAHVVAAGVDVCCDLRGTDVAVEFQGRDIVVGVAGVFWHLGWCCWKVLWF